MRGALLGAGVGAGAVLVVLGIPDAWQVATEDPAALDAGIRDALQAGIHDGGESAGELAVLAAVTVVAGAVAGWLRGPRAVEAQGRAAIRFVIGVALRATVIGAFQIALLFTVDMVVSPGSVWEPPMLPIMLGYMMAAGLLFYGLPALLVTIPTAWVWWRLMLRAGAA